jgi:hypothetical protein
MQTESQFLSAEDIKTLTGRKNKTQQIEWLRNNGVQHYINMAGRPVVPKTAISGIQQPASKQAGWKPAIVSS